MTIIKMKWPRNLGERIIGYIALIQDHGQAGGHSVFGSATAAAPADARVCVFTSMLGEFCFGKDLAYLQPTSRVSSTVYGVIPRRASPPATNHPPVRA